MYLICGLLNFSKYLFWEVPFYMNLIGSSPSTAPKDAYIEHASESTQVKSFWKRTPWYETEDSDEARTVKERMLRLTADFGEEPHAMARCGGGCGPQQHAILAARPDYVRTHE
jgi:hypothetical protein